MAEESDTNTKLTLHDFEARTRDTVWAFFVNEGAKTSKGSGGIGGSVRKNVRRKWWHWRKHLSEDCHVRENGSLILHGLGSEDWACGEDTLHK